MLAFLQGILVGAGVHYFDASVVRGWLGFENPYALLLLGFMWAMALVGIRSSEDPKTLVMMMLGIPIGVVAIETLRVTQFGAEPVLPFFDDLWAMLRDSSKSSS